MQLLLIRRGAWEILAVCSAPGQSQVVAMLVSCGEQVLDKVNARFRRISERGPEFQNDTQCRLLRGSENIWEFKVIGRGHAGVRIAWFRDRRTIVCTNAFEKAEKTPQQEIKRAEALRSQYLRDQAKQHIEVYDQHWKRVR